MIRLQGVVVGLAGILLGSPCLAAGVGLQAGYAYGAQEVDYEQVRVNFDNHRFRLGVAFDTSLARDRLLHYRVGVSYVRTTNDADDVSNGASIDQAVGFGLLRSAKARVWAGPALRVGVDIYEGEGNDLFDITWGLGPRLGVNWHVSSRLTLAASFAYHYQFVREKVRDALGTEVFHGSEHLFGLTLSLFVRSRDDVF